MFFLLFARSPSCGALYVWSGTRGCLTLLRDRSSCRGVRVQCRGTFFCTVFDLVLCSADACFCTVFDKLVCSDACFCPGETLNFTGPWSCDVGRRNELILVTIMNVCSVTSTHVGQDATHSHDHEVCGFNEHTATSTARLHRWLFWVLVFHDHLPALLADGGSTIARSAGG